MMALKESLKKTRAYKLVAPLHDHVRRWKRVSDWHRQGCPVPPPPEVKHATINDYGKRFGLKVLIETGTLFGQTIAATRKNFTDIYSIELSPELHRGAKERFARDSHVHLLQGDSGVVLQQILPAVSGTPLFWLDAHYSGDRTARGPIDTPIVQELETIFLRCPDAVVLIDDARLFDGTNSYPTLAELRNYVGERVPHWEMEVKDDIIRICSPPGTPN